MQKSHLFILSAVCFTLLSLSKLAIGAQSHEAMNTLKHPLEFAGGTGTQDDPWLIETPDHLNNIRNYTGLAHADKYFLQVADLNLDTPPWNVGDGWLPIGTSSSHFEGNYSGDGYSIEGLYINRPALGSLGMWGFVGDSGKLHHLHLVDADVTGGAQIVGTLAGNNRGTISYASVTGVVNGGYRVGGMVGENNPGIVEYCYAHVTVNAANGRIGGLVGFNVGGTVYHSHTTADVTGGWYVGGVVGRNIQGTIQLCYATGNIIGGNSVGGLVGDTEGGSISNGYAAGNATGGMAVGGLIGYLWQTSVSNCYAIGAVGGGNFDHGGLVGYNFGGSVTNSFWNIETSGQSGSSGGTGKTTLQMTTQTTFINWDFDDTWSIIEGESYPWLQWQGEPGSHNFPGKFIITLIAVPENAGSLTINPDKYYFAEGEEMTLTATAEDGFTFVSWKDADDNLVSSLESFVYTMPGHDVTLFAHFSITTFSVTFNVFDHDGLPINDATITLDGATNEPGDYLFEEMLPGEYDYSVVKEGYDDIEDSLTITDQNITVDVVMQGVVSIFSLSADSELLIFPNPASSTLNIISNGKEISALRLLNSTGREVYSSNTHHQATISIQVSGYKPGIYLLKVFTKNEMKAFRVLINF
jgi:hypothetical protein